LICCLCVGGAFLTQKHCLVREKWLLDIPKCSAEAASCVFQASGTNFIHKSTKNKLNKWFLNAGLALSTNKSTNSDSLKAPLAREVVSCQRRE
jgi:hypothetical protein